MSASCQQIAHFGGGSRLPCVPGSSVAVAVKLGSSPFGSIRKGNSGEFEAFTLGGGSRLPCALGAGFVGGMESDLEIMGRV